MTTCAAMEKAAAYSLQAWFLDQNFLASKKSTQTNNAPAQALISMNKIFFFSLSVFSSITAWATSPSSEQAVLGGGCCWCTEAIFEQMPGVTYVQMGFAGGTKKNPTYQEVCTGKTGHAEVVKITYDPKKISYNQVLDFFWCIHDPTSINKQGPDKGPQYRSIILTMTSKQQRLAEISKKKAQEHFSKPIVTEIKPLVGFYPVRADHHGYYQNHPNDLYCRAYITPELKKLGLKTISRPEDSSPQGQKELERFQEKYLRKHAANAAAQ